MKKILTALLLLPFTLSAHIITTIAGGGSSGLGDGGQATACELDHPSGVALDAAGNLYIADRENNRIRKVAISGVVTTIAGTGAAGYSGDGGPATLAALDGPFAIAIGTSGDIYFSEADNSIIRKIDPTGLIATVAGTGVPGYNGDGILAITAQLSGPGGIAIDDTGNIYVADFDNNRVRKINTSGIISTVAGTGVAGHTGDGSNAVFATLDQPEGLALDLYGSIYIAEYRNDCIRKIASTGVISTLSGSISGYGGDGGPATAAKLYSPMGVCVDLGGNVYISDAFNNRIRVITQDGIINTVAGTGTGGLYGDGGDPKDAELSRPVGITVDPSNKLYIADYGNDRIRTFKSQVLVDAPRNSSSNVSIFPNPNNGAFTLQVPSVTEEVAKVVVCDAFGRQVAELVAPTNSPTPIELSVPPGIYFLSATTGDAILNTKILISH